MRREKIAAAVARLTSEKDARRVDRGIVTVGGKRDRLDTPHLSGRKWREIRLDVRESATATSLPLEIIWIARKQQNAPGLRGERHRSGRTAQRIGPRPLVKVMAANDRGAIVACEPSKGRERLPRRGVLVGVNIAEVRRDGVDRDQRGAGVADLTVELADVVRKPKPVLGLVAVRHGDEPHVLELGSGRFQARPYGRVPAVLSRADERDPRPAELSAAMSGR